MDDPVAVHLETHYLAFIIAEHPQMIHSPELIEQMIGPLEGQRCIK